MNINFNQVKQDYEQEFSDQLEKGSDKLSYHIEDWNNVLDKYQLEIFREIKSVGVWLFPFYPIGNHFVNFGNPFSKVGIEIIYKNFKLEKEIKIQEFEKKGWEIHGISSIHNTLSVDDLYTQKHKGYLEDLSNEDYISFLKENKNENLDCLLHYIKDNSLLQKY